MSSREWHLQCLSQGPLLLEVKSPKARAEDPGRSFMCKLHTPVLHSLTCYMPLHTHHIDVVYIYIYIYVCVCMYVCVHSIS